MSSEYICEIAIVGGGPVGTTLAHLLGRMGLDIIVFEKEAGIHPAPRAVGVDDLGLRIWGQCGLTRGLWPDMTPLGTDAAGMVFRARSGRRLVAWRPAQRPFGWPRGVTMVQTRVEERLRAGLEEYPNVRFLPGHEVTSISESDDGCRLAGRRPDGTFIAGSLRVIGCEGGQSVTRRAMGAQMPGSEGSARWLIVDTTEPHSGRRSACDVEVFGAAPNTVVSVPRKGGHRRWEFRLAADHPNDKPPNDRIRKRIEENGGAPDVDIHRALIYRFATRRVTRFARGRLALAGDSAHVMPPYAAQGLACGLGDAANLYWRLWLIARHDADDRRLLSDYDAERRYAVRRSQYLTGLVGLLVTPAGRVGQIIRDGLIDAAARLPPIRHVLTSSGMRAFSRYDRGTFLRRDPCGRVLPCLETRDGEALDAHFGAGFTLLVNAPGGAITHSPSLSFWRALNTRVLYISTNETHGEWKLSPPPGRWARWLSRERVLIVRPDRVVLASGRVNELRQLTVACARALGLQFRDPRRIYAG